MSAESLQGQASCSICLEFFQDPVSIHCGHSFCRACITQSWERRTTNFSCPQCRETMPQQSLRPNWELASLVEVAKRLSLREAGMLEEGDNLCQEHQEALKLFCEEEQSLICVVCDKSKVHRGHFVVPAEEAAQEYKERIQTQLQALKEKQANLQGLMKAGEDRVQDYMKRTRDEKQKILRKFAQMRKFLDENEACLLSQLKNLHLEIQKSGKETLNKLSEELPRVGTLIGEMEWKCEQPGCEILKDIKNTLSRWEKDMFSQPLKISEVEGIFFNFTRKTADLSDILENFQGELEHILSSTTQAIRDLDMANTNLHLSDDRKAMLVGRTQAESALQSTEVHHTGLNELHLRLGQQGVAGLQEGLAGQWGGQAVSASTRFGFLHPQRWDKGAAAPWMSLLGSDFPWFHHPEPTRGSPADANHPELSQEGRVEFFDAVSDQKHLWFSTSFFQGRENLPMGPGEEEHPPQTSSLRHMEKKIIKPTKPITSAESHETNISPPLSSLYLQDPECSQGLSLVLIPPHASGAAGAQAGGGVHIDLDPSLPARCYGSWGWSHWAEGN